MKYETPTIELKKATGINGYPADREYLCVTFSVALSERPVMKTFYYPLLEWKTRSMVEREWITGQILGRQVRGLGEGQYVTATGHMIRFFLINGGQTLPISFDDAPIKKPPGFDVRWELCRWVKYTKANGRQVLADYM